MGIPGSSTVGGTSVVLRTGATDEGMLWTVAPTSDSRYMLIAKSGRYSGCALAVNAANVSQSGAILQQLTYTNDTTYNDEWYICSQIDIGMSTDNSTTGECHSEVGSKTYASIFYEALNMSNTGAPTTLIHHYNLGDTVTASKSDFAVDGAISNEIDFMVYIGHGHVAHDSQGNHLHYDCGILGTPHSTTCNPAGNVYTSEVKFGSDTSDLRWVWLYSCNFLTTGTYVTDDDLAEMMNGAHIVMGYASQSLLCRPNAQLFAEYLRNGMTIYDAFFLAGRNGEASVTDDHHLQRIMYISQARYETIYSPQIHYQHDISDIMIITRDIQASDEGT